MNIDMPMIKEPMIPDLPLGAPPREVQGDPRGRDGGGGGQRKLREGTRRGSRGSMERRTLGARTEERRGSRRSMERSQLRDGTRRGSRRSMERRKLRDRRTEGRTGHARNAAEEPVIWRMNRDGTWRRFVNPSSSKPLSSVKVGHWRPWDERGDAGSDTVQTIVSIADPRNDNHPVYYTSTDIRQKTKSQKGNVIQTSVFHPYSYHSHFSLFRRF